MMPPTEILDRRMSRRRAWRLVGGAMTIGAIAALAIWAFRAAVRSEARAMLVVKGVAAVVTLETAPFVAEARFALAPAATPVLPTAGDDAFPPDATPAPPRPGGRPNRARPVDARKPLAAPAAQAPPGEVDLLQARKPGLPPARP
jgi:hypothetical protein